LAPVLALRLPSTISMVCCGKQPKKPEQSGYNTGNLSSNEFVQHQPMMHQGMMSGPPQPAHTVSPGPTVSSLTPYPNSIAMIQLSIGASPAYPSGWTPPPPTIGTGANPQILSYAPPPTIQEGKLSVSIDFGTTFSGVVCCVRFYVYSVTDVP
jgi:hypothetical protein